MPQEDTFQQLQTVLQQFKTFLDTNKNTIKPAVEALKSVVPQVVDLIDKLITLMNEIKTEINNINPAAIPGLQQVTDFTGQVTSFLTAAKPLLPASEASAVDDVQNALGVVSGLGNLQGIKTQLLSLIDDIIADLNFLKS